MGNPVVHFEIAVEDLERAKTFYQAVFDVEMTYMDMGEDKMYLFDSDMEQYGCSGALYKSDAKPSTEGATVYFGCEDVAHESAKVTAAGGQVILEKMSLGEHGFCAMFIDTEGNRIGLHSPKQ